MPSKSKKSPAKKSASRPLAKKKPLKLQAKSKSAKPKPQNIFWKILEERKKQKQESPHAYRSDHRGHPSPKSDQRHEQFAKFAGPRRRAA